MARRFNFDDEDTYVPSRFTPRVQKAFSFDENDERFNPPKINTGYEDDQPDKEKDPYEGIISRYRQELGREQPALAKYRSAMENMPQRQDYDLNKWGKLGAALSGFGAGYQDPAKGVAVATALREAPYKRALTDYDNQLKNLGEVAGFEDDDRKNRMAGIKLELDEAKNRATQAETRRLNDSLIGRRGVQNTVDQSNYGLANRRLAMDENNSVVRNSETGRHNLATENTGDFNANTGRMNANTNRGNLGLNLKKFDYGQSRDNVDDYHWEAKLSQEDRKIDKSNDSFVSPSAQSDAEDLVTRHMIQNPAYFKFFEDRTNKGYYTPKRLTPAEMNTPEYKDFELERARQIDSALMTNRRGNRVYTPARQ